MTSPIVESSMTAPSVGCGSAKAKVPPGVAKVVVSTTAPSHVGVISKKLSSPSKVVKVISPIVVQSGVVYSTV